MIKGLAAEQNAAGARRNVDRLPGHVADFRGPDVLPVLEDVRGCTLAPLSEVARGTIGRECRECASDVAQTEFDGQSDEVTVAGSEPLAQGERQGIVEERGRNG